MFTQARKEQVDTFIHEIGHIFGLRHFFANVSETAWPSEIFGRHENFSIMNYGALSELTDADKDDLTAAVPVGVERRADTHQRDADPVGRAVQRTGPGPDRCSGGRSHPAGATAAGGSPVATVGGLAAGGGSAVAPIAVDGVLPRRPVTSGRPST